MDIPENTTLVAYTEDLALVVTAETLTELTQTVNFTCGMIADWIHEAGLELAAEKTEAVILAGKRKCGLIKNEQMTNLRRIEKYSFA